MDLETAISDLSDEVGQFPSEAVRWLVANPEISVPALKHYLQLCIDGRDEDDLMADDPLFLGIHVLAEMRETSAFPMICELIEIGRAESVFGDAVTETLPGVLISTFDGDIERLCRIVETVELDPYARMSTMFAVIYLGLTGAAKDLDCETWMRGLAEARESDPGVDEGFYACWADAVALSGFEGLRPLIAEMFEDDSINSREIGPEDLERSFAAAAQGEALDGLKHHCAEPFPRCEAVFSSWYYYTPAYLDDIPDPADLEGLKTEEELEEAFLAHYMARHPEEFEDRPALYVLDEDGDEIEGADDVDDFLSRGPLLGPVSAPVSNPYRDVGRNDPCPCGSGKKFKKCHGS
jgi:Protein of unknown function (DUF1186)/SEC-C motif